VDSNAITRSVSKLAEARIMLFLKLFRLQN